ncbi:hypothetical protein F5B20DRAFT_579991 [Whalleya microplaca]|nr:hypothetical protein F5B20DRAFT_579991 [Whalleya microplaca]
MAAFNGSICRILLDILYLSALSQAGAIAAWYNGKGAPQVIMQDDSTSYLFYSFCNSPYVPVFPDDGSTQWDASIYRIGSSTDLVMAGWQSDDHHSNTSIWYQDPFSHIIADSVTCNASGYFNSVDDDSEIFLENPSMHPKSAFAILGFGGEVGYKMFYKYDDLSLHVNENDFTASPTDGGPVSQDRMNKGGFSVAACVTDNGQKTTVVTPRDNYGIEVATIQPGKGWEINTASARFGFASDPATDRIWIYYMSGGSLIQVHMSGVDNKTGQDIWEQPIKLTNLNSSTEEPTPGEISPGAAPSDQADPVIFRAGLSTGGKAGIGIGVPLGVIALVAAGYILFKRSRSRKTDEPDEPNEPTNIHELENEARAIKELPAQEYSHELEQPKPTPEKKENQQVYEMPGEPAEKSTTT